MRFKTMPVTPKMAQDWLKRNKVNRRLRKSLVTFYAKMMKNGEWQLTHQGIAFNKRGQLVDGQHRLSAIVLAGMPVKMSVCYDAPADYAMGYMVDKQGPRSLADILGVDYRILAPVTYIAKLYTGERNISPKDLKPFQKVYQPGAAKLLATTSKTVSGITQAGVRAAFLVHDTQFTQETAELYRDLVNQDFSALPPSLNAFTRQTIQAKVGASVRHDFTAGPFLRAHAALEDHRLIRIVIKNPEHRVNQIRRIIEVQLNGA